MPPSLFPLRFVFRQTRDALFVKTYKDRRALNANTDLSPAVYMLQCVNESEIGVATRVALISDDYPASGVQFHGTGAANVDPLPYSGLHH